MTSDHFTSYFTPIEEEYKRIRDKESLLQPLEWALIDKWKEAGIPLEVVIDTMREVEKNFKAKERPGQINSLRYFEQAVARGFEDWKDGQAENPNS